jgi:hypothetical protein
MTPRVWSRTPPEILQCIALALVEIANDPDSKGYQSSLLVSSVACWRSTERCRAGLFHSLTLRSPGDAKFLDAVLRSPLSGWLSEHIRILTLQFDDSRPLSRHQGVWISLSRRLSSLIELRFLGSVADRKVFCPLALRPCPRNLRDLSHLQLRNCRFFSFSSLLYDLSSLSSLRSLHLLYMRWGGHPDSYQPPRRLAPLLSIREVYGHGHRDDELWPLSWIFAGISLRYSSPCNSEKDNVDVPIDMNLVAITEIIRMVEDIDSPYGLRFSSHNGSPRRGTGMFIITPFIPS